MALVYVNFGLAKIWSYIKAWWVLIYDYYMYQHLGNLFYSGAISWVKHANWEWHLLNSFGSWTLHGSGHIYTYWLGWRWVKAVLKPCCFWNLDEFWVSWCLCGFSWTYYKWRWTISTFWILRVQLSTSIAREDSISAPNCVDVNMDTWFGKYNHNYNY